ncbi:MAG TPA: LamG-like jellyroll fold domain-containing protein, partial [Candidatus Thermoplasmatota archaeon]|nr:LamG-like jellyroll fold domain-containing protein [Candidatus Thermoplasmatota archaeon]
PPGQWSHVEVEWHEGLAARVHVNGRLVAEAPLEKRELPIPVPLVNVTLGGDAAAGVVDEVRLYEGPLDEATLKELATFPETLGETSPDVPGALGIWHFERDELTQDDTCCFHDASGNGNYGKREPNTTFAPGRFGSAIAMADRSQWVVFPFGLQNLPDAGTLSLWVKPAAGSASGNRTFLLARSECGSLSLFANDDHTTLGFTRWWWCESGSDGISKMVGTHRPLPRDTWTHLLVTWGPGGHHLWMNGARVGGDDTPAVPVPPEARKAPDAPATAHPGLLRASFEGALDEVRLYGRVLTAEEVRTLAAQPDLKLAVVWPDPRPDWPEPAAPSNGPTRHLRLDREDAPESDASPYYVKDIVGGAPAKRIAADGSPLPFTEGYFGDALRFQGPGDTLHYAQWLSDSGPAGTVSLWVRPDDKPGTTGAILHGTTACGRFEIYRLGEDAWVARNGTCNGTFGGATLRVTGALPAGKWTHLAFSWSSEGHFLYVNGQAATPRLQHGENHRPVDLRVGAEGASLTVGGPQGFWGAVDDLRFYNRALAPGDVRNLLVPT